MHASRSQVTAIPDCLWLHTPDCSKIGETPSALPPGAPKIGTKPLAPEDALYLNADIVDVIWQRIVVQQRIISRLKNIVRRQQRIVKE